MAIKISGSTIIDDSRKVINASHVGIGTTNPTVELDVDGDVNVSGVITSTKYVVEGGSSTAFLKADGSTDSTLYGVGNLDSISVKDDGQNVGSASTFVTLDFYNGIGVSTTSTVGVASISLEDNISISGIFTASGGYNIGIQSAGTDVATGVITALNFIGSGNTFAYNESSNTIDISISASADIVNDTTPELGGNLDLNSNNITGTGNIDITGDLTLTDTDGGSAAGPELKLFRNSTSPEDADYLGQIKFAGESSSGIERNYAKIRGKISDASNTTEDGILEFTHIKAGSQNISGRWTSTELQLLNGTHLSLGDDQEIRVGTGDDLKIYHTGSTSYISDQGTGSLRVLSNAVKIKNAADNEDIATFTQNGSVELYYDNSLKFETTGIGVSIVGTGNTATITGPSNLVLDPAAVGDATGTVTILGNLQVDGTQTIINSTTLEVDDKLVSIAKSATNASQANGAGLEINGASATLTYASSGDKWVFNKAPYYNTDRLLTTADEGSGNGIDADTLDGQEGSHYLDYTNFTNTPTIPTVNDATLTLATSGDGISGSDTFTANQSTDTTFTVTVSSASTNQASTLVYRDASGGFSAGIVTATSFVKASNSSGFLKADGTEDTSTYLTSYTETQTLDDVVGLGSVTTQTITVGDVNVGSAGTVAFFDISEGKVGVGTLPSGTSGRISLPTEKVPGSSDALISAGNQLINYGLYVADDSDNANASHRQEYVRQFTSKHYTVSVGADKAFRVSNSNSFNISATSAPGGMPDDQVAFVVSPDTSTELRYNYSTKLETTGYGVTVAGGAYVSGISTFQDDVSIDGTSSKLSLDAPTSASGILSNPKIAIDTPTSGRYYNVLAVDATPVQYVRHLAADLDFNISVSNDRTFLISGGLSASQAVNSLGVQDSDIAFKLNPDTSTELRYNKSKKFETTGYGVTVTGGAYVSGISTFQDDVNIGTAAAAAIPGLYLKGVSDESDFFENPSISIGGTTTSKYYDIFVVDDPDVQYVRHWSSDFDLNMSVPDARQFVVSNTDGTSSVLDPGVPDSDIAFKIIPESSTELRYNKVKKLETTTNGIAVSGIVTAVSGVVTYYGDGSQLTGVSGGGGGGGGEFNSGITSSVHIKPLSYETSVFTFPSTAGQQYTIESINVANIDTSVGVGTTVHIIASIEDATAGEQTYIAYNVPIVNGGVIELLKNPIVAGPSDVIKMWVTNESYVGVNNAAEVYMNYSEFTSTDYVKTFVSTVSIGTTDMTSILTSTSNPTVLESIHLANRTDTGDYPVSVRITQGTSSSHLVKDLIIPRYSTVDILDRPKRIETDSVIEVKVEQTSTIDVIIAGKKITS